VVILLAFPGITLEEWLEPGTGCDDQASPCMWSFIVKESGLASSHRCIRLSRAQMSYWLRQATWPNPESVGVRRYIMAWHWEVWFMRLTIYHIVQFRSLQKMSGMPREAQCYIRTYSSVSWNDLFMKMCMSGQVVNQTKPPWYFL
jgi:hypothetical protein